MAQLSVHSCSYRTNNILSPKFPAVRRPKNNKAAETGPTGSNIIKDMKKGNSPNNTMFTFTIERPTCLLDEGHQSVCWGTMNPNNCAEASQRHEHQNMHTFNWISDRTINLKEVFFFRWKDEEKLWTSYSSLIQLTSCFTITEHIWLLLSSIND